MVGIGSPELAASSDRLASPPVSASRSSSSKARRSDCTLPSRAAFSSATRILLTLSFRYAETIVRDIKTYGRPLECGMSEVQVLGGTVEGAERVLSKEALEFLAGLHDNFAARRDELLAARGKRREEAKRTGRLDFLPETKQVRESEWRVAE